MGRIAILDLVEYEKLIGQRIDSSKIKKVIGRWTAHDRHKLTSVLSGDDWQKYGMKDAVIESTRR